MSIKTINVIVIMAILTLFVPAAAGTVVTQDVEIRGEIANGIIEYDYSNFAGFWYDLDKDHESETMNVTKITDRTIAEGDLVYTCIPHWIKYKNKYLNTTYGGYDIIGFRAEKYICYDGKIDQLVKLLIEWGSSKDVILTMGNPMELPEGYMLAAPEIDLQGDKVWLKLYKDGECIDDSVITGGSTYVYEDEDDVPQFAATIDSVFRGTESNMVVVKYIFMRSDEILDIDSGDSFGVMEVKSTSGSIVLKNDETITLDSDSEVDIMDGLYFKVADDSSNLRYYLAKTVSLVCPECPECPELVECPPCPDCPDPEPCPECPECPTPQPAADKPNDDAGSGSNTTPGFEAVFAIAGLLVVGYLVLKQRE